MKQNKISIRMYDEVSVAEADKLALQTAGIEAWIEKELTENQVIEYPFHLLVYKDDEDIAEEVLEKLEEEDAMLKEFIIGTYHDVLVAEMAQQYLESYDIFCFLKGVNLVSISPNDSFALGGIDLIVNEKNAKYAAQLLHEWEEENKLAAMSFMEEDELVCENCGGRNIVNKYTYSLNGQKSMIEKLGGYLMETFMGEYYMCLACKKEWKKR